MRLLGENRGNRRKYFMAMSTKGKHTPTRVQLSYQLLRNTTSPDEKAIGVQSFVANLPAPEILKLDTAANLRSYLAEYDPRKRNRVHDAIQETIVTEPERFIVRNSGFVITATDVHVDDNKKIVVLTGSSLINGAQSQGEIRKYLDEIDENGDEDIDDTPFFVRASIIIDPDPSEIVETAIARNIATPIKSITEAGARNQLDELETSIAQKISGAKIRKRESDVDVIDTRRVLQLARLLMPPSVAENSNAAEKLRAYKNPEQCLTDFCHWFETKSSNPKSRAKYDFTVQIAPHALLEYDKWSAHPDWNGHHIWEEKKKTKKGNRAVRRDKRTQKIAWVSPAILFPLMGALSEFASKDNKGRWQLQMPSRFKEGEMIRRAVAQFRAHQSDPILMGRSEAAYDALRIYPQTLMEVLREIDAERR
jgi:AIPR protein